MTKLSEAFKEHGTPMRVSGNTPFLLDDPDSLWWVAEGQLEVFSVLLNDGVPAGSRQHFFSVHTGQVALGMALDKAGMERGFLAVGHVDTVVYRFPVAELRKLAAGDLQKPAVALVDVWLRAMSGGVSQDITPRTTRVLRAGETVELQGTQNARAARGVVWIEQPEGLLFLQTEAIGPGAFVFPVTQDTSVQAVSDRRVVCRATADVFGDESCWQGIRVFCQIVRDCELMTRQLLMADELNRIGDRQSWDRQALEKTYRELGAVMAEQPAIRQEEAEGDPLFTACRTIGRRMGVDMRPPPEAGEETSRHADRLNAIAHASRVRFRAVKLEGDWWRGDHGDLLAHRKEDGAPVALLQVRPRVYEMHDPTAETPVRVTAEIAAGLDDRAHMFYRPFPERVLTRRDLLSFGLKGAGRDLFVMVAMAAAGGLLGAAIPLFTRFLFDTVIPGAQRGQLLAITIALACMAFIFGLFQLCQNFAKLRMETRMDLQVQAALLDRLLSLPVRFFRQYAAGDLADRIVRLSDIRFLVSSLLSLFLVSGFTGLFNTIAMFVYDVRLGLLGLGILGATLLAGSAFCAVRLRYARKIAELDGKSASLVLQLLTGIAKLRSAGAEIHAFAAWSRLFSATRRHRFAALKNNAWFETISVALPTLAAMIIFGRLGYMLMGSGPAGGAGKQVVSLGSFLAFNAAFTNVLMVVLGTLAFATYAVAIFPIFERLKPIMTTVPEIDDVKHDPGELTGAVEVTHVSYRYDPDGPLVLDDVSISIRPGEFVAFVGPSGSGKSTMLRLLLGFDNPETGAIHYDAQDLRTLDTTAVRRQIGTVMQNMRLLPGSILESIRGSRPLSLEQIKDAVRMGGLEEDIAAMPMGLHTVIGAGSSVFSGGQRQRILIARAIAAKPRIMFFDEATSALDNRTQALISHSLDQLQATRVVIAHRLSTVMNADRIIVLVKGTKVQEGTFKQLMEQDGPFADLARRQMLDDTTKRATEYLY